MFVSIGLLIHLISNFIDWEHLINILLILISKTPKGKQTYIKAKFIFQEITFQIFLYLFVIIKVDQ
jgi:hypothetical protein